MIDVTLSNVAKRFRKEWIFRNVNLSMQSPSNYVILGSNGSGKSTLAQILSGYLSPSSGNITYSVNSRNISSDLIYRHLSIVSPYIELPLKLTLLETIDFHFKFKRMNPPCTADELIAHWNLGHAKNKLLSEYSSGMLQRVKLGLAVFSQTEMIILDEPCSNLDSNGIEWYNELIMDYTKDRLVVVCSNAVRHEYLFCDKTIEIEQYKD